MRRRLGFFPVSLDSLSSRARPSPARAWAPNIAAEAAHAGTCPTNSRRVIFMLDLRCLFFLSQRFLGLHRDFFEGTRVEWCLPRNFLPTGSPSEGHFMSRSACLCILFLFATSLRAGESPDGRILAFLERESREIASKFLAGMETREKWQGQAGERRRQYLEMLGLWPLPEKTPLNPKVTGTHERDGFRVENLHFQSRPGLYVTANLYLPAEVKEKLPAVLYVCGHSGRGRDGNKTAFQHHGMWFATHGFVCLITDTLQLGEVPGIHHGTYNYGRWWWPARGYTPAGVECWNGIRAIDYLQSRPEVDAERIAITGISGGGMASFWVAAADERVKAAVPVSGLSDLETYVVDRVVNGHCDCMFLVNTFKWPTEGIAAMIAPRPLLFANSD